MASALRQYDWRLDTTTGGHAMGRDDDIPGPDDNNELFLGTILLY